MSAGPTKARNWKVERRISRKTTVPRHKCLHDGTHVESSLVHVELTHQTWRGKTRYLFGAASVRCESTMPSQIARSRVNQLMTLLIVRTTNPSILCKHPWENYAESLPREAMVTDRIQDDTMPARHPIPPPCTLIRSSFKNHHNHY